MFINQKKKKACAHGFLPAAQVLLEHGANINAKQNIGVTPLMQAVRSRNLALVKFLLDKNADINVADDNGDTALHYAYRHQIIPIIRELEDRGANPEAVNKAGQKPHEVTNNTY